MRQWVAMCMGLLYVALADMGAIAEIEKIPVEGIHNFSRSVDIETFGGNQVGFGGTPELMAMEWLNREGYRTVISLLVSGEDGADVEGDRATASKAGLRYVQLPFDPKSPAPELIEQFMAVVGNEENQPVYIHCNSATRAAALWMVARFQADGLDPEQARLEGSAIAEKPEVASRFFDAYLSSISE